MLKEKWDLGLHLIFIRTLFFLFFYLLFIAGFTSNCNLLSLLRRRLLWLVIITAYIGPPIERFLLRNGHGFQERIVPLFHLNERMFLPRQQTKSINNFKTIPLQRQTHQFPGRSPKPIILAILNSDQLGLVLPDLHNIGGFPFDVLQHEEIEICGNFEGSLLVVIALCAQFLKIHQM